MRLPTFYEQNLIPNWGNYNMMFLITESWDLSDEDKAFLLNTTPGAVRTMAADWLRRKYDLLDLNMTLKGSLNKGLCR